VVLVVLEVRQVLEVLVLALLQRVMLEEVRL
jgi:hypothetical protein